MIETLFPPDVVTVIATPDMWDGALYPEEAAIVRGAVLKRKREFAAGRLCARKALHRLGIQNYPLVVGENREPLWPTGIVGSLSHCLDYCGVAVSFRDPIIGIGLDVEPIQPLTPETIDLCFTSPERAWLISNGGLTHDYWPKVIFSAKESVYKCYFPLARNYLDFQDVELHISPQSGQFSAMISAAAPPALSDVRVLCGRFAVNDTHVFTAITLTSAELNSSA